MSQFYLLHDLSTARYFCSRIAIMYVGEIVEIGDTNQIFNNPNHPYTWSLLNAIPIPDPDYKKDVELPVGEVPDSINPPSGCRFHPRCQFAQDICKNEKPLLVKVHENHFSACHLQNQLDLKFP